MTFYEKFVEECSKVGKAPSIALEEMGRVFQSWESSFDRPGGNGPESFNLDRMEERESYPVRHFNGTCSEVFWL